MDYKELAERLKCPQIRECPIKGKQPSCGKCQKDISKKAATAITDLLSRAEAAEARCKALETRMETAEKMVKEYQDEIIPGYRERAEKAEAERDRLEEDLHLLFPCVDICYRVTPINTVPIKYETDAERMVRLGDAKISKYEIRIEPKREE